MPFSHCGYVYNDEFKIQVKMEKKFKCSIGNNNIFCSIYSMFIFLALLKCLDYCKTLQKGVDSFLKSKCLTSTYYT